MEDTGAASLAWDLHLQQDLTDFDGDDLATRQPRSPQWHRNAACVGAVRATNAISVQKRPNVRLESDIPGASC